MSEATVFVVAGVMPIDLMAEERRRVYETKEDLGIVEARTVARAHSIDSVSYTHLDVYKRQVS